MRFPSETNWRLAAALLLTLFAAATTTAQTSAELRAKYGEPEKVQVKDGRVEVERYMVRPHIAVEIIYTKDGKPCEVVILPVPATPPVDDGGRPQLIPEGRLMPTDVVIALINELAPVEQRGEKITESTLNGGDDKMLLHHPGCQGIYTALYEHVTISCHTWCWGGTFSVVIHWGERTCRGQRMTVKKKGKTTDIASPSGRLMIKKQR